MPTPKRGPRLGGSPAHQKQILANLASDLFRHGRVKTTLAKAKTLRPYAERLITKGKQGDLPARRQALSKLHDRDVVAYLFEDVAPRFADRNGGYTRIVKLGPRKGDNAPMALIELVEQGDQAGDEVIEDAKAGRMRGLFGRRRRQRAEAGAGADAGAATALLDQLQGETEDDEDFDVDDDEQVAQAIAEATGGDAAESPDSDDSADSPDSADSADSADSPDSPDSVDSDDSADSPDDDEADAPAAADDVDADAGDVDADADDADADADDADDDKA